MKKTIKKLIMNEKIGKESDKRFIQELSNNIKSHQPYCFSGDVYCRFCGFMQQFMFMNSNSNSSDIGGHYEVHGSHADDCLYYKYFLKDHNA